MPNFSPNNFEKSLKNYKIFINGILILNSISFGIYSIVSIFAPILYNNRIVIGSRAMFLREIEYYASFIPGLIAIFSFFLYFIISKSISTKIPDHKLREIFKSIKSLNNLSFILLILFFYPIVIFYFIWGSIIYLGLFFTSYNNLRKKEIYKLMRKDLILGLISFVIGGLLSYLFIILYSFRVNIVPGFVLIGIALINKKVVPYFSLKNSERLSNLEKIQQIFPQTKLYGQISETNIKPVQEIKVVKADFKPESVKISNKSTQEEVVEQIYESNNQPEIIIKEKSPQIEHQTTVLKTDTEPEIKLSPQKVNTKKFGMTNLRKSLKKLSEKPIQSKIIKKEDISQVSKKKCPFCGKEHDDLNTPFCHACGYKF